ncbi:MAG: hypothetical protein IPP14_02035 [Planctomycetes bacterium]|nr:hypothetical protein [Planctomycetota bacterium]
MNPSNHDEEVPDSPAPGDEVVEDEDIDLDPSELELGRPETVLERLQRAKERGQSRQMPGTWHDTPVNVTPSGRHEIIEEEDEDLTDQAVTLGEAAHAVTRSGRSEVIDEHDDLDDEALNLGEVEPGATPSGRQEVVETEDDTEDPRAFGLGDIGDLDESSLVAAASEPLVEESEFEPSDAKPGAVERIEERAEEHVDTETMVEGTATVAETRMEPWRHRDTERGLGRAELDTRRESRDQTEPSDNEDLEQDDTPGADSQDLTDRAPMPPKVADTERSPAVRPEVTIEAAKSDTAQESDTQDVSPQMLAQIPSGATGPSLIDNPQTESAEADRANPEGQIEAAGLDVKPNRNSPGEAQPDEAKEGVVEVKQGPDSAVLGQATLAGSKAGAEKQHAGDRQAGTFPPNSTPAKPDEVRSQRWEGFTVADDSGAPLGRGLDVGTANLVAARMDEEGGIEFFPARNAFLDVPEDPYTLKMLKSQGVPYIKRENRLYVIGEDAFELANIFNREMRRPMKNGLISPTDVDAMPMEVELFKKILGPPRAEGEMVYYSIPADPVDSTLNIVYHTNIANGLLERLGYRGTPFNEGQAIVFSELGEDDFTGIGISCGGGMVNVCVAFRSMNVISFSSAKGGDWIDQQAAQVMGCAASKITAIKERGVDINAPKSPEEEAIVIYYRHLIKYSLDNIVKKFSITKDIPNFPKPVAIAISGGTSKVGGFVDVFKDEFSKMASKFPIKISDIRQAEDQLNATAKGCLLAALSHED